MPFAQPALPYALDALKPFLSEEQMSYHYGKHHAAYFTNLNRLLESNPMPGMTLKDFVLKGSGGVFNNAAQCWNHTFFWHCLSPTGGGEPGGKLAEVITRDFGGFTGFKEKFATAAATLFGSGWAWLARTPEGKLEILGLGNADNPLRQGKEPLLTLDVWEHAYYVDYRNLRPKFIEGFWTKVNWAFAESNLQAGFSHP